MQLKYFAPEEFKMDNQVVFSKMQPEFLALLDQCRQDAGIPFKITSSWRSPSKNRMVGGSPGSLHLKGRAIDLICTLGESRAKIIRAALNLGLSVGVMRDGLHLDNRENQIVFHYYDRYRVARSENE